MKTNIIFLALTMTVSGCGVSGNYRSDGPCKGFHKDPLACERAYDNSLVANKVQIGQSMSAVREVMNRDPERREANAASESWLYLTDYTNQVFTMIIFQNGKVVEIKQSIPRSSD